MRDGKVLFLQIPGAMRPAQARPVIGNDILKLEIDPIVCGYKHDRYVPLDIFSLGVAVVSWGFLWIVSKHIELACGSNPSLGCRITYVFGLPVNIAGQNGFF